MLAKYIIRGVSNNINSNMVVRGLSTYKTSTGLVGVPVDVNGRENLIKMSNKVLESVKKIPADATYRLQVESLFKFINKTATELEDVKAIEDRIDKGQIEEVLESCTDELELIDYYHDNKLWELVKDAQNEAKELEEALLENVFLKQKSTSQKK